MDWAVQIQNLTFKYPGGEKPVLENLNLNIGRNEFVLLVGPSGCGKTTLVNCINGIIPHVIEEEMSGRVIVEGLDTTETPLAVLSQHVGTVFQNPDDQIFNLTVEEEVAFGPENLALPTSEIKKRVDDALRGVGIEHLRDREIATLSGGQKQRVAIASILAMKPKILILDEPTSDLDPLGTDEVLSVVKRINKEYKSTIILVEHKLEDVAKYVDRVILMDQGRIIADSDPRSIFGDLELLNKLGVRGPEVAEASVKLQVKGLKYNGVKTPLTVDEARDLLLKNKDSWSVKPDLKLEEEEIGEGDPIIQVEDLWHIYPNGVKALKGVNLTIYKGEYVGIIGQNGAGKSTLVSHFLGLLKPTRGRVLVAGIDTREASVGFLAKKVGYIFQNPDFMLFNNTVWSEVAFGLKNIGLPKEEIEERVREAIEIMGLEGFEDRHPHALSRGQRHRVAVASVLAMHPEILIMDEPTNGQDYGHTRMFMELAERLNNQGTTIIVISHDMRVIAEYTKRTIVLKDGEVFADGPTRRVLPMGKLRETMIKPPAIVELSQSLAEYGLPRNILTVDEFVNCINIRGGEQ